MTRTQSFLIGTAGALALLVMVAGIAWAADIFTVDQSGAVYLRIASGGNVGIGAESPGSRLTVRGSGTTSTTSGLDVQAGDGTSRVFVRDDGNVGIGTTGPSDKLEVEGGNIALPGGRIKGKQTENFLALSGNTNSADGPDIELWGNGHATRGGELTLVAGNGTNGMVKFLDYDGTGWNTNMVVLNTGNVGIGTSSPTSKLHVVGLPVYANNGAAVAGGLTPGAFYRTGGDPDLICVVH